MILYFSGTGNSRYVAQVIQEVTSDEIDLDIDTRRDAEIAADKPPHHN